jgi:cell division protease FtsH
MNLIKKIAATLVAILTLGFLLGQSYFGPNIKSYFGPSTLLADNATSSSLKQDSIPSSKMTYGHFLEYLDMGWVTKVDLYENGRMAVIQASSPELGNRPQQIRVEIPAGASQLITKLRTSNVDFDAHTNQTDNLSSTLKFLGNFVLPIGLVGLVFLLFRSRARRDGGGSNMGGGPGQLMNLGKAKTDFQIDAKTGVMFADVAGIEEAKEEFEEIVTFLKTPEKFTAVGAKIPRGVMLVGPPGTGKTLLAKAIAGEAGVPFLSISGSEFVEMFVGVGASRVRDLFKKAKTNAPCIIFIDEIDAVGRQRGAGVGGGNDEREQTLNQLLTEMDGFEGNTGIIVVAATNRVDILDSALLRPGRFDRQITVNLPDVKGRLSILKVHARNKKFNGNVSLNKIAQRTPGFSGADLANLLNEASILAARQKTTEITANDISISVDRIVTGLEGNVLKDSRSKRLVAYQKVGQAITGTMLKYHDPVEKVTLIPRGQAQGLTWFTPVEDQGLISRGQILARIIGTLGGRAAEEIIFGEAEITTGASGEIMQCTSMARQMVTRYGMSPVGPMAFEDSTNNQVFLDGTVSSGESLTLDTTSRIDNEVQDIISHCHEQARSILAENRVAMDRLVEVLVEEETIEGDRFREILGEYSTLPERKEYQSYFSKV